jgi:hypothetical protein
VAGNSPSALAETEIIVADATDAETARRFVRHIAALGGWKMSNE